MLMLRANYLFVTKTIKVFSYTLFISFSYENNTFGGW